MLKILNDPLSKPISSFEGEFKDPCSTCQLGRVCVQGCRTRRTACAQKTCYRQCNDCGGGPLRHTGADVPAICCKAPLKDVYLSQVRKEHYNFTKREFIDLKQRSIVITQGSPGRVDRSPYPDKTSAIAVNIRHVWSRRGWFSQDMRDYLKLESKDTKLILLTATHDDVLERAWDAEAYDADFKSLGFDYWQALEFSQYGDGSNLNNLWQGYRTLSAIEASKAHFVDMLPSAVRVLEGKRPYRPWYDCGLVIPQVMVNWQFNSLRDVDNYRLVVSLVRRHLKCVPAKAIWFIGVVSAEMVFNLQRAFPQHRCYFMSVNPWLAAHKGDEFTPVGRLQKSKLPKTELVLLNQRNYANLVMRAVKAAHKRNCVSA
jgi:hypothetical protein